MIKGMEIFKAFFRDYQDQYVLIGGAACDIVFSESDLAFRATKDLDMVLIVEALTKFAMDEATGVFVDTEWQEIVLEDSVVYLSFCKGNVRVDAYLPIRDGIEMSCVVRFRGNGFFFGFTQGLYCASAFLKEGLIRAGRVKKENINIIPVEFPQSFNDGVFHALVICGGAFACNYDVLAVLFGRPFQIRVRFVHLRGIKKVDAAFHRGQ